MTFGTDARNLAAVTLAYAAMTFVMALPFSLTPHRSILGDVPDAHMYVWTLAWDAHAFVAQPLHIFDANIYHPYANTLAYSENLIGSAVFAAPVAWATGNALLATNLTALLSCVLCGVGAYVLARRLHISVGGAFICGVIFAFAPPRFVRMGQLHMTAVQWIPFCLAFLHSYFEHGRRRDLLLATGFFSWQALASGHGAAYLTLAIVLLVAWQFAFGAPLSIKQRLNDFGVAGAYLIAPAVWVMLPYRLAQTDAGLRGGYLSGAQPSVASYLASPAWLHQLLQRKIWGPLQSEPDAFLFPGILVLLLAVVAIVTLPARRPLRTNHAAFYLLIAALATLMFVPWPFEMWRYVYWLPGLNFIRMPSRFIIVTVLALSVLAGLVIDRLTARFSKSAANVTTALIATLLLIEFNPYPFSGAPFAIDPPAIDRWLDTQPKPFVVAELPVPRAGNSGAVERHQTRSMFHATAHWQKTVHGYSSLRRPLHDQLYVELAAFPDETSITSIHAVGVTHVVVHTEEYGDRWPAVEAQIARVPTLRLLHVEGAGRVYSVVPP